MSTGRVISKYLKTKGIEAVFNICNRNLRSVKAHLRRLDGVSRSTNISYQITLFKKFINDDLSNKFGKDVDTMKSFLRETFRREKNFKQ